MDDIAAQSWVQTIHIAVAGDIKIRLFLLVSYDEFSDGMASITAQLVPAQLHPRTTKADYVWRTWSRRRI